MGLQLLLQDEDETNALVWFDQIRRAIQRLPCGSKGATQNRQWTHHIVDVDATGHP